MKKPQRSTLALYDHRRLILARRMVTRTRAGAACAPCKARKTKCSDYRPCARCSTLHLEDCQEGECMPCSPISLGVSPYFFDRDHPKIHEDGLSLSSDIDFAGSFNISLIAPHHPARQSWMPTVLGPFSKILLQTEITAAPVCILPPQLAGHSNTGAFDRNQVPRLIASTLAHQYSCISKRSYSSKTKQAAASFHNSSHNMLPLRLRFPVSDSCCYVLLAHANRPL
jgi:hypothetical protein